MDPSVRWLIRRDVSEILMAEAACKDPWSEEEILLQLRQRDRIGVVIESPDHEVVGYMVYRLCKERFELLRIAIRYPYRRQGYGRRLLGRLIEKLPQQRRNRIICEVRDDNLTLQLFLQEMGFRCVRVVGDTYRFVYRMKESSNDVCDGTSGGVGAADSAGGTGIPDE